MILHPGRASRSRKGGITPSLGRRRRRRGRKAPVSPGGHLAGTHHPCRHSQSAARAVSWLSRRPRGWAQDPAHSSLHPTGHCCSRRPRESHGRAGAAGNAIQPSPPAPTASPPWRNIRFSPPASPGDGSGLPPVGGITGGTLDPESWGGTSGWGVVCGCRCSPHRGPRVPFCCSGVLGGSRRGTGGRRPLPRSTAAARGVGWRLLSKQKQIPLCGAG